MENIVICDLDSFFVDALVVLIRGILNCPIQPLRLVDLRDFDAQPVFSGGCIFFLEASNLSMRRIKKLRDRLGMQSQLIALENPAIALADDLKPHFSARLDKVASLPALYSILHQALAGCIDEIPQERHAPAAMPMSRGRPKRRAALTSRQLQVLNLIESGSTNAEIAHTLHISANTVRLHVSAILRSLNVPNRTAAVHVRNRIATGSANLS
ncbi:MAG: LuxR C-terminal-related transcriptional regulator [Rhizomicrobium sp.]